MYNALEIADYVLGYYSFERDMNISNLKLQNFVFFTGQSTCYNWEAIICR